MLTTAESNLAAVYLGVSQLENIHLLISNAVMAELVSPVSTEEDLARFADKSLFAADALLNAYALRQAEIAVRSARPENGSVTKHQIVYIERLWKELHKMYIGMHRDEVRKVVDIVTDKDKVLVLVEKHTVDFVDQE